MNIKELRQKNKPVMGNSIKEFTKQFYQSSEWRNFREESRQIVREKHEAIAVEVYENNLEKNDPADLMEFLNDPKKYPLSELSLKQGIVKRATVLDHIREVRLGGAKLSHSNVQWITKDEHYKKTVKETKRNY